MTIGKIQFGIISDKTIRKMAVTEVTSHKISEPCGVYDPLMGTIDPHVLCGTCGKNNIDCPGHFGFIDLAHRIIHPLYYKYVVYILKCICCTCSRSLLCKEDIELLDLNNCDNTQTYFKKVVNKASNVNICMYCREYQPSIQFSSTDLSITMSYTNTDEIFKTTIGENEIYNLFDKIPDEDVHVLGIDPKFSHPRNMILSSIVVIPPVSRPYIIADNVTCDDDITIQYMEIIKLNNILKLGKASETKMNKAQQAIKFRVKSLFDNTNEKAKHTNGRPIKGFKKRISGKEGQIRTNIMGKRVDKSARTVIGPDPTLRMDELALPEHIANILTYPINICRYNIEEMTKLVNNDGANYIIRAEGKSRINLKYAMYTKSTKLYIGDTVIRNDNRIKITDASNFKLIPGDQVERNGKLLDNVLYPHKKNIVLHEGDVVERKLRNGDVVLLNRQPTLHRGSMLAHKIVIRPGKTIRMNLANTKSFNADFDGDEMNIHIPNSIQTKTELQMLAMTNENLISVQSSKPNIVIVQDALLGAYILSKPDSIVSRETFFQIACKGDNWSSQYILSRLNEIKQMFDLSDNILYSGRSLIGIILPKTFNYISKEVNIKKGFIIDGFLSKSSINGQNGIIQTLLHDYGQSECVNFINNIQFIANEWLLYNGFSISIADCIATKTSEIDNVITRCFVEATSIDDVTIDDNIKEIRINAALSRARDHGMKIAKEALRSDNNFLYTVTSGSKGDYFNIAQITGLLGQQNFSGKRIEYTLNDNTRSLPHYHVDKMSDEERYESKGFIKNSFIHGLNAKEFWFHAITGREGVTDTAMKTAQSGYIQRRMVKLGENVSVKNDLTVRGKNNQIIQFQYGDNGLDPTHTIIKNKNPIICDVQRICDMLNES